MSKKLWCISVMLLIGCFCMTPEAEAIFASGSIQISPQIEGNPNPIFCDPLDLPSANVIKTGDIVKFTVAITNESAVTIGGTKLPAVLANSILEIDACSINANCDGSRLPDTFDFIKCDIVDSGVASCVDDGNGGVTITMKPVDNSGCPPTGGVALAAGQQKILVVISKLAVSSIATLDPCGQFFASAATAPVDLIAYQCPSKVLGGAQGSTTLFYPSTPCIEVTKRCDPESGCYPGDIEISGEIKNCGDETLINVKATDSEAGAITDIAWPGTPGVLEVGQTASYKAKYPGALGKNPDTVTVTGSPISGKPDVTDDANAECELKVGEPTVTLDKVCTDAPTPNDPIKYTIKVKNTSVGDCLETLTNCNIKDNNTCGPIVWDSAPPANFSLAPGQELTFTGTISKQCPPEDLMCDNTAEIVCKDILGKDVKASDSAQCIIPKAEFSVSLDKSCTPAPSPTEPITYSIVVKNTSPAGCAAPLKCTLTDEATCNGEPASINYTPALPYDFELAPGQERTFPGAYSQNCPPKDVTCKNLAKVSCTDINGNKVEDSDDAICTIPSSPISVKLEKECVSPTSPEDSIQYKLVITNTSDGNCPETLKCKLIDEAKCNGAPAEIIWEPALPDSEFEIKAGAANAFMAMGSYSVPCNHDLISCNNQVSVVCTDQYGREAISSDDAECSIPPCREEICRTPGFWGTHAGTEKPRSQNITQAVINKGGPLQVCGEIIDNTMIGCGDSALEAICVSVKGTQQLQLVRQLTAAALNCIMSNGNADCSGVSIDQIFADCNSVCKGDTVAGWDIGKCIGAIDCFNNGGIYKDGFCQTGTCSNDPSKPCNEDDLSNCGVSNPFIAWLQNVSCVPLEGNCHERELCNEDVGLCFEPPGPAGSSRACNEARKNSCYVAEGCSDCP